MLTVIAFLRYYPVRHSDSFTKVRYRTLVLVQGPLPRIRFSLPCSCCCQFFGNRYRQILMENQSKSTPLSGLLMEPRQPSNIFNEATVSRIMDSGTADFQLSLDRLRSPLVDKGLAKSVRASINL